MARMPGVRKADLPDDVHPVWESQEASRGAPQPNTPVYPLCPSFFRGHRALAAGIDESGLFSGELKNLASVKASLINGFRF